MRNFSMAAKVASGDVWHFTWSSNSFVNRAGSIIVSSALETHVMENVPYSDKGFFNLWHIPGSDFAVKKWIGMMGHFLVEAGPYLDTPMGQAAKRFFTEYPEYHPEFAPEGWGASIEYIYYPQDKIIEGNITFLNKAQIKRTSTLPKAAAKNIYTLSSQIRTKGYVYLSEGQIKLFKAVFGTDVASDYIKQYNVKMNEVEMSKKRNYVAVDTKEVAKALKSQFEFDLQPVVNIMAEILAEVNEISKRVTIVENRRKGAKTVKKPSFRAMMQTALDSDGKKPGGNPNITRELMTNFYNTPSRRMLERRKEAVQSLEKRRQAEQTDIQERKEEVAGVNTLFNTKIVNRGLKTFDYSADERRKREAGRREAQRIRDRIYRRL